MTKLSNKIAKNIWRTLCQNQPSKSQNSYQESFGDSVLSQESNRAKRFIAEKN